MKPNCSTAAAPHVQYAKTRGFRRDSETSFGRTAISVPGLPTIRAHLHRTLSQSSPSVPRLQLPVRQSAVVFFRLNSVPGLREGGTE